MRPLIARIALLSLSPIVLACSARPASDRDATTQRQSVPGVETAVAEEAPVRDEFLAPGAIAIDVDLAEVRDARAADAEAEARLRLANEQVRRLEPLVREAIAPKKELDAATAEEKAAAAALERVRATLAAFGGAEDRAALRPGESWAIAQVMQPDIARCTAGAEVELVADALPSHPFAGSIEAAPSYVDPTTRLAPVPLRIVDRESLLRPGMTGRVTIRSSPRTGIVVPRSAVVVDGDASVVFVARGADGGGAFAPVRVAVGARDGDRIEIVRGLAAGTRVATTGAASLLSAERLPAAASGED